MHVVHAFVNYGCRLVCVRKRHSTMHTFSARGSTSQLGESAHRRNNLDGEHAVVASLFSGLSALQKRELFAQHGRQDPCSKQIKNSEELNARACLTTSLGRR